MKGMLRLSILFATLSLSIGCSHHSDLTRPAAQDNFGALAAPRNEEAADRVRAANGHDHDAGTRVA